MQSTSSQTPPSSDAGAVLLDPAFVTPRSGTQPTYAESLKAQVGDQTVGPVPASDVPLPESPATGATDRAPSPSSSSEFEVVKRIPANQKNKARDIPTEDLKFTGHQSDEDVSHARSYSPDMRFGSFAPLAGITDDAESETIYQPTGTHPDYSPVRASFTLPDLAEMAQAAAESRAADARAALVAEEAPAPIAIKSPSKAEKKTAKKVLKAAAEAKALRRRSRIFGGVGAGEPHATPVRGVGVTLGNSDSSSSSSSSSGSISSSSSSSEDSDSSDESSSSDSDDVVVVPKSKHAKAGSLPVPKSTSGIGKGLTKIAEPKRYSGDDDTPRALRMWERDLRSYLLMGNVHPDSYLAMAYIGSALSGEAKRWYGDHVIDRLQKTYPAEYAHSTPSPFPLKKIVASLTTRFVSETSYRDATFVWNRISQTERGRVKTDRKSVV